jgi:REP element-mobilizing transposase RayT
LHVTWRILPHVWSLRTPPCYAILKPAFRQGAERFGFRLTQWTIQSNHLHLVVEAADRRALARGLKGLGVRIARGVNRLMGSKGRVFADRYHASVLRSPRQTRNALLYVLNNHLRHGGPRERRRRGCRFDPYSSAWWFDGWRDKAAAGPVPEVVSVHPPPVAAARTWLLATGWRRAGLLRTDEAPGGAVTAPGA